MDIIYLGHSCFQLKGKRGTVITDPYHSAVGFAMPNVSADLVTVSHQHSDHSAIESVTATARREKPFIVSQPGEYEVAGISVFGIESYHDANKGAERGDNTIYTILLDDISVCHLGDLGHELTPEMIEAIGAVDVVLCPVGGVYTINPTQAVETINLLEPAYAIPMHYGSDTHEEKVYGELQTLSKFLHEYGMEPQPLPKLHLEKSTLPEETELVVLEPQHK